jgi:hypothetical protein
MVLDLESRLRLYILRLNFQQNDDFELKKAAWTTLIGLAENDAMRQVDIKYRRKNYFRKLFWDIITTIISQSRKKKEAQSHRR